jgi:hypothetical protein
VPIYRGQGRAGKEATGGNRWQLMAFMPLMAEGGGLKEGGLRRGFKAVD